MEENEAIQQEESSRITLTDENGENVDFEYLDCIEYAGKEYLLLLPVDDIETQVVIFEIQSVDDENETYLAVDDEQTLDAVYAIFKERYKDILTFAD